MAGAPRNSIDTMADALRHPGQSREGNPSGGLDLDVGRDGEKDDDDDDNDVHGGRGSDRCLVVVPFIPFIPIRSRTSPFARRSSAEVRRSGRRFNCRASSVQIRSSITASMKTESPPPRESSVPLVRLFPACNVQLYMDVGALMCPYRPHTDAIKHFFSLGEGIW